MSEIKNFQAKHEDAVFGLDLLLTNDKTPTEKLDETMDHKDISATLDEREQTYGDYSMLAQSVEQMESFLKGLPGWQKASPAHRESAHMIIQKLARAFNGNPHYSDSWHDIAGYAKLAEKECKQQ